MYRRVEGIITFTQGNKLKGHCRLIETDIVAGWCGVDLVSNVTFEHNTAKTLYVDVEGTTYRIPSIRRGDVARFVRSLLECENPVYRQNFRYNRKR